MFLFWDASRAAYVLLSLTALAYLIRFKTRLPGDQRFYSWPILGFIGAALVSLAYQGFPDSGVNIVTSRYLLLLCAIPLVSLYYACFDCGRNPWPKFILGIVIMGILAIVDIYVQDAPRAGGGHNEAVFGFVASAMTCIVIASYPRMSRVRFGNYYYISGLLMGFCAMFLSGTRSAWIVAVAVTMIAGIYYLDRYSLWKRIGISLALICAIAVGGLTIPVVKERVDQGIAEVAPYFKAEQPFEFNNVSYRVESWKAAWNVGMTEKLLGVGPGNYKIAIMDYIKDKPRLAPLVDMNHSHNQFMQSFAMTGFVGLFSFIVLLGCHFWIFVKYLHKRYSMEVRSLALAGFLLLVAYSIYSIPGVPFYGKQYLVMYAFTSASIWGTLLGAVHKGRQSEA